MTREHLLLTYLDVLDRLSGLYLDQHQYGACVALCRLLVERDRCREDAHRRLMRCLTRQGQSHLALRQYQACADALDQDLGRRPRPGHHRPGPADPLAPAGLRINCPAMVAKRALSAN